MKVQVQQPECQTSKSVADPGFCVGGGTNPIGGIC